MSLETLALRFQRRLEHFLHEAKVRRLKAGLLSVGEGFQIGPGFEWLGASHIAIGQNCFINRGSFVNGFGGLTIGDNVVFGPGVVVWTVNHDIHGGALPFGEERLARPVVIGSNVWLGIGVTVVPGATIGEGAVVGAGTVVSGEVPPMQIVAGQKWRTIGERDAKHYRSNLEKPNP
jgi:maltose O-acetyltransferase